MKEPNIIKSNDSEEDYVTGEENIEEKDEDETLKKEEKRRKARLRRRGPYRKAHANW